VSLAPGTRLGPYEITTPLGAGGMGEVYRAHDSRLRRDVAIKVIAARFGADPDLLKRFEQEALASAALNHPNIVAVYDVGSHEESPYLVTELLEGESLRRRLSRGALPVRTVIQFGLEMVRGATAAHEKSIVHRDLKPENVFVTNDERLKILDFGLAKLAERGPAAAYTSQLATAAVTELGTILGTAGYMAPEQIRGETADHRSDVFAIGAILYEMLTGHRAFHRETPAETLTAILRDDPPDILETNPRVPAALVRLVGHCLEKKPADRFQSARDLAFALDTIDSLSPDTGAPTRSLPQPPRSVWRPVAAVAAIGALAAGVFVAWRLLLGSTPPLAEVRVHRLTDARGLEEFPAISPDGKSIAFVAQEGGKAQIYLRLVAGGTPLQVTRDIADHLYPRWAADSASIIYYQPSPEGTSDGAVWEIPALGGASRRIAASAGGADLSHDGQRLVFPRFASGRMELATSARDGTNPKTLAVLETGYQYITPRWSFDDRLVAYQRGTANTFDIFVVSADGGESRQLTQHGARLEGLTWASAGPRIIFASSRGSTIWYLPRTNLWAVEADGAGLQQLTFGDESYAYPDTNASGTIVVNRVRRQFDIWRYPVEHSPDENVRQGVRITQQTSDVHTPSVAPGDRELAYVSDSGGHANIWVVNLDTRQSRQVTFENNPGMRVGLPLWSPSGTQIAYFTSLGSSWNYFLVRPDGSDPRLLARDAGWATWSPDGQWLYFSDYPIGTHLRKVPATGGAPVVIRSDRASRVAISPDGASLYYAIELPVVTGGSDLEIRVARPESGPSRLLAQIPARRAEGFQPVISPDGKWLALALLDGVTSNLWALSTSTGQLRQLTDFGDQPIFITRRVSWSSDGRSIFAAVGEGDSDVVWLEGLKP
jgi:serine/threonine protein kinase/Tol biopolymer transport system component